jgi:hypothetical protein
VEWAAPLQRVYSWLAAAAVSDEVALLAWMLDSVAASAWE